MIAVIDYGVGNLFSVEKALLQFADDVVVTGDEKLILAADKLVLPGVGDFGECMSNLEATGLIPAIRKKIADGTPLLVARNHLVPRDWGCSRAWCAASMPRGSRFLTWAGIP